MLGYDGTQATNGVAAFDAGRSCTRRQKPCIQLYPITRGRIPLGWMATTAAIACTEAYTPSALPLPWGASLSVTRRVTSEDFVSLGRHPLIYST